MKSIELIPFKYNKTINKGTEKCDFMSIVLQDPAVSATGKSSLKTRDLKEFSVLFII